MSDPTRRPVWKWTAGKPATQSADDLAAEAPLEIRVNRRPVSVTLRTPGHDDELAVGFLYTEGLIAQPADAADLQQRDGLIDLRLPPERAIDWQRLTRHVFATSSCGICGRASIEALESLFPPLTAPDGAFAVDPWPDLATLAALPDRLLSQQSAFARTGGLHAAGLFDRAGNLVWVREDVGRHNAVDKVVGRALLDGRMPLDNHLLVVSGRASFEIVQKTLAARIPVLAAVSAPSSLAVEAAEEAGITLIGFLRPGRLNVYTHPERLGIR